MFFTQRKKDNTQEILVDLGMYVLEKRLTDCTQEINQEIERLQELCFHKTESNDRILISCLEKSYQHLKELEKYFLQECDLIKIDISDNSIKSISSEIHKLLDLRKSLKQSLLSAEKDIQDLLKVYHEDCEKLRRREKIKNTFQNLYAFFFGLLLIVFFSYYGFIVAKSALGFKILDNISNVYLLAAALLEVISTIILFMYLLTFKSIFDFLISKIETPLLKLFIMWVSLPIMSIPVFIFLITMGPPMIITIKPSLVHFAKNIIDQDPVSLFLSFLAALSLLSPLWQFFLKWFKFIKSFSKYNQFL